jgi:uncharacterized membrane protein YsdA (DUF1294 family)
MPVESIIVSLAVVAVFTLFAVVLFWVDRQSNSTAPKDAGDRTRRRAF